MTLIGLIQYLISVLEKHENGIVFYRSEKGPKGFKETDLGLDNRFGIYDLHKEMECLQNKKKDAREEFNQLQQYYKELEEYPDLEDILESLNIAFKLGEQFATFSLNKEVK